MRAQWPDAHKYICYLPNIGTGHENAQSKTFRDICAALCCARLCAELKIEPVLSACFFVTWLVGQSTGYSELLNRFP